MTRGDVIHRLPLTQTRRALLWIALHNFRAHVVESYDPGEATDSVLDDVNTMIVHLVKGS